MQFIQDGIRYNRIADGKVSVEGFGLNMDSAEVNIPHYTKKGYMVIGIAPSAFAENQTIRNISIPDTICWIGEKAFHKCPNLETLNMTTLDERRNFEFEQGRVLSIREKSFSGCKKLSKFCSIKSVELIGKSVFKNCSLLPKLDGTICRNLPDKSFFNCFSLSEFSFSSTDMKIGIDCFEGCANIKDFYIEKDLELSEEFLNNFRDSKFHCHENSKYLSLAYSGYHVEKILPRI